MIIAVSVIMGIVAVFGIGLIMLYNLRLTGSVEEFHRFLPYAVALEPEKAWGAQFSDTLADFRFHGSSLQMLAEYEHCMQGE